MLFLTILTLYTSRVVLKQLGVVDFGIYNIVGGIVTILNFFNSSMSVATQRYMSFDIGRGDLKQLNKTFNASLLIYLMIGITILILLETVGLWYVNNKMVFPEDRTYSVNVVYQFSILTFIVNLTQLPYNALILARQKMQIYAFFSFVDTVLKLAILYLLFFGEDKLILYSILIFIVTVIVKLIYQLYCQKYFKETKLYLVKDRSYLKELLFFSGWNLFGNIAAVARNQGINLVLNLFFGVTLNAAYAIAIQVQNAVGTFVTNFQKAINPQIIQSYAKGNDIYSLKLVNVGAKFSFYLIVLIVVPFLIHTEYILNLWLTTVPSYTVQFVKFSLVVAAIDSLSGTLMTMCQATGRIKWYQTTVGLVVFLNLPISYLVIKIYSFPEIIYLTMIILSAVAVIFRVIFLKKIASFDILYFLKEVVFKVVLVSLIAYLILYLFLYDYLLNANVALPFLVKLLIEEVILLAIIFGVGLSSEEKKQLRQLVKKKI